MYWKELLWCWCWLLSRALWWRCWARAKPNLHVRCEWDERLSETELWHASDQADLGYREIFTFLIFICLAKMQMSLSPHKSSVQIRPSVWIVMTVSESVSQYGICASQLESCSAARQGRVWQRFGKIFGTTKMKFDCQCLVRKGGSWHLNCVQISDGCVKNSGNSPI